MLKEDVNGRLVAGGLSRHTLPLSVVGKLVFQDKFQTFSIWIFTSVGGGCGSEIPRRELAPLLVYRG